MTSSRQERRAVPSTPSRPFGALSVVAQFLTRVIHWSPGGPSRHDAMVSLTQHTRLVDELTQKANSLQAQIDQTLPLLEATSRAVQRLQDERKRTRMALELAATIDLSGSVKNARARDAAAQALMLIDQQLDISGRGLDARPSGEDSAKEPPVRAAGGLGGRYGLAQIAWELERTALGEAFYGAALRAARHIQCLSDQDRLLLDRYAAGAQSTADHQALQQLATFVDVLARHEALVLGDGHCEHFEVLHEEQGGNHRDAQSACRGG